MGTGHGESRLEKSKDKYAPSVIEAVESWRVYHFHDTGATAKMKQLHAPFDTLRLKVDGANLAAYLGMLKTLHPANYRMIVDAIQLVAPFFGDFVHGNNTQNVAQLEWTEKGKPDTAFNAHALSDGTLRFICLATLLLQPWELDARHDSHRRT